MNCSICFKEKEIFKKMRGKGGIVLNYCKDCHDSVYAKVAPIVMAKIEQARKEGKKIGLLETIQIVKEISNESKN